MSCLKPSVQILDISKELRGVETSYNQKFQNLFLGGNYILAFLLLFIAGLLMNLTPCVYPMVPITIGFFTLQAQTRMPRLLFLGIAYALGICSTYSLLGYFAATTGNMFGMFLQHKLVLLALGLFIFILALSMFGLFEIRIPSMLLPKEGKKGIIGSFIMGASLGLVAAPCIGPFILGLLAFVSNLGNKTLGFLIFFFFSLGLAFPYIFLALFSGSLKSLPKSGSWLQWVKRVLGIILIALALYTVWPVLSSFVSSRDGSTSQKIEWVSYRQGVIEELQTQGKPLLVDFYADWCFPCHIMDETTFSDDRVATELKRFERIKVDLTFDSDEKEAIAQKYEIRGVPTYLFFDSHGRFLAEKTLSGAVDTDEFLMILKNIP